MSEYSESTQLKDSKVEPDPTKEFLRLAHKRFQLASKAEDEIRKASLDDLKFRSGDQWPQDIKIQRSKDGRPCLEMDQIEQALRQVCNEERQQRPSIQVNPVGDGADVDTAEVEQGLVRHIEVQSQADVARDHAFEMMVTIGFGYYRLIVEEDEMTGDLEIFQRKIKNPFTVYFQPNCQMPDYSDAKWCFIIQDMGPEEYKAEYPNTKAASLVDYASEGDNPPGWMSDEYIRVAEYFYVEGKGKDRKVKWAKINALECMEGGPKDEIDILCKWITVLPVLGIDLDINGKRYLAGLVRKMKDPQRQYNYMNSAATEAIALAPKAPWVIAEGQIENHETEWKQSNVRNFPVLQYKQVDLNGKPAPPPQRSVAEPPIQAMMLMVKQAHEDLQAASGLYAPSLGAPSADHSGKAILARQKQGDVANLNWTDNLSRTMWHEGRMLLDLIPKVYTESKVRRIINPDGTSKMVGIVNGESDGQNKEQMAEQMNVDKVYDIGIGSYDVAISVGPNYQSKRQEAVATQTELLNVLGPQAGPLIADIVVSNMDIPGSREIAARLKKMLPPQLQDDDGSPEASLQNAQAQVQQLKGQLQQATGLLQQQHQVIETKAVEADGKKQIEMAKIQGSMAIEKLKAETQIAVAQINASKDLHESFADNELEQFGMIHDAAHETAMAGVQHQQAKELQDQQQAADATSQTSDQMHQAGMAQQEQAAQAEQAEQT